MSETPLDAQKRVEARKTYEQLTARINALDTDIGRSLDSQQRYTVQQLRDELAGKREAVAAELSALGWNVGDERAEPSAPATGRDDYYRGLMADENIRQSDKQLERLDGRLVIVSDGLHLLRQELAVTKANTDSRLDQLQKDLAITMNTVLALQEDFRRLTDKLNVPPRGLSTNRVITIVLLSLFIIAVLVAMTAFLMLRPI